MPLSSKSQPDLPTHRQYIKSIDITEPMYRWDINRVMWNNEWKTVTFVTDVFRYSVKHDTPELYRETTNWLMDGMDRDGYVYACITYDPEEREWTVYWESIEEYPKETVHKCDKFDWGIVLTRAERPVPTKKPASRKKPAS